MGVLPIYDYADFRRKHRRYQTAKDDLQPWLKSLNKYMRASVIFFLSKPEPAQNETWKELYRDMMAELTWQAEEIALDRATFVRQTASEPRSHSSRSGRGSGVSDTTPTEELALPLRRIRLHSTASQSMPATTTVMSLLSDPSEPRCGVSLRGSKPPDTTSAELAQCSTSIPDYSTNSDLDVLLRRGTRSGSESSTDTLDLQQQTGRPSSESGASDAFDYEPPSSGPQDPSTESSTTTSESPALPLSLTESRFVDELVDSCLPPPKRAPSASGSVKNASSSSPTRDPCAPAKRKLRSPATPIARRTRSNKQWWSSIYGV